MDDEYTVLEGDMILSVSETDAVIVDTDQNAGYLEL